MKFELIINRILDVKATNKFWSLSHNNRVKVRRSQDGTTKWVSPSQLISRDKSTEQEISQQKMTLSEALLLLGWLYAQQILMHVKVIIKINWLEGL